MMSARILIDFAMAEGAVPRMLGLVERRGFQVRGIGMEEDEAGETASLTLEVSPRDAGRRLDVLDLQLRRLVGVRDVITFNPAGQAS